MSPAKYEPDSRRKTLPPPPSPAPEPDRPPLEPPLDPDRLVEITSDLAAQLTMLKTLIGAARLAKLPTPFLTRLDRAHQHLAHAKESLLPLALEQPEDTHA